MRIERNSFSLYLNGIGQMAQSRVKEEKSMKWDFFLGLNRKEATWAGENMEEIADGGDCSEINWEENSGPIVIDFVERIFKWSQKIPMDSYGNKKWRNLRTWGANGDGWCVFAVNLKKMYEVGEARRIGRRTMSESDFPPNFWMTALKKPLTDRSRELSTKVRMTFPEGG